MQACDAERVLQNALGLRHLLPRPFFGQRREVCMRTGVRSDAHITLQQRTAFLDAQTLRGALVRISLKRIGDDKGHTGNAVLCQNRQSIGQHRSITVVERDTKIASINLSSLTNHCYEPSNRNKFTEVTQEQDLMFEVCPLIVLDAVIGKDAYAVFTRIHAPESR